MQPRTCVFTYVPVHPAQRVDRDQAQGRGWVRQLLLHALLAAAAEAAEGGRPLREGCEREDGDDEEGEEEEGEQVEARAGVGGGLAGAGGRGGPHACLAAVCI